jgi:hypothetical protein
MLDDCAPGHVWVEKDHHFHVHFGGKVFRTLPKGEHGGKGEIEIGWVRKMVRYLGITDCARSHFQSL